MRTIVLLLLALNLISPVNSQTSKPASPPVVVAPRGKVTYLASPDRKWKLVFECPDVERLRQLWLERDGTLTRRLVREYERSVDMGWAPDSRMFFVNDDLGSDEARPYLYDAVTLKETDLTELLRAADPTANQYLEAGHSYFQVRRWVTSKELLATLRGHFDNDPYRAFFLKYRVQTNGVVRRPSEQEYYNGVPIR